VDSSVDRVMLIDTGESAKKAIALGRDILGSRCLVREYPGEYTSCADGRNFALDCAAEAGFSEAVMLDTDERLHVSPGQVDRIFAHIANETILLCDDVDTYKKEKFFRLPRAGRWDGPVHEAYCFGGERALVKGACFSELPKSPEELAVHVAAIEVSTRKAIADDPGNSRWHYYHGDVLVQLGRHDEAVDDFLAAALLSQWHEEIDWSHYRAAVTRHLQDRHEDAIRICLDSSLRTPELAWFAASCMVVVGRTDDAVEWATKAIQLGEQQRETERLGFCNKYSWYEGPELVIRKAHQACGRHLEAGRALVRAMKLRDERLATLPKAA
jgi:tetratricopeptide (TPR) repeat protein